MEENITFKQISKLIMDQAKEKGFGTTVEEVNVPEKFALIHSEVSEAYEAYRHNDKDGKDGYVLELGDALSRILHLAGILNIDIEKAVLGKLENNKTRTWDWSKMNEKHT